MKQYEYNEVLSKQHLNKNRKHKIVYKLTAYFTTALLLFAIIIGGTFMLLFRNYTVNLRKSDLETRAVKIASTLSEYMSNNSAGPKGGSMGGYGAYLRFLDDIAMADVWIVDEELKLLINSRNANLNFSYSDLPNDAEQVVKEVFLGKTTFSEGFSDLLQSPTITVGTPIVLGANVIGALLLHSPVSGVSDGITQGVMILVVSIVIAMSIAIFFSIMLAVVFTKPLAKMKNTALQLAAGDYSAKTNVYQNDEIGEVASTIDVLSERLDAASRESEQLNQLRRDFITNISHELRTPVTVIRGSLEALFDEVVTDPIQVKQYYKQMLSESISLQRLVNDLLDLSRLQNSDFSIETHDIDLCEILQDVVRSSKLIAKAKNIEIVHVVNKNPANYNCPIKGDYSRLRQMFMIVLDNAIKFSPPNSKVQVFYANDIISIKDQGPGISSTNRPFIFDRFYRADSEDNQNGTGLGLSIAKQIADRHGIQIDVVSSGTEGTEFKFTL